MNIAYLPSSNIYYNNNIFDNKFDRDNITEPFVFLKIFCNKNSWGINTIDQYPDLSIINIALVERYENKIKLLSKLIKANPEVKIIYLITEEKNIAPLHANKFLKNPIFDAVLTWDDNIVDNKFFIKYFYFNPFRKMVAPVAFNDKKFLAMIYSYKLKGKDKKGDFYGERLKIIDHFGSHNKLDLYGMGWEKANECLIEKIYQGPVDSKIETLRKYKFSIAFENSNNEIGGISEKIFDVMAAGCVPIYMGAPNILDFIPGNTFIDYRKFLNYNELENYLDKMPEDVYNRYMGSITTFLQSENYKMFTSYGFVEKVSYAINKVTELPNKRKSIFLVKLFFLIKIIMNVKTFWKYYKRFVWSLISFYNK